MLPILPKNSNKIGISSKKWFSRFEFYYLHRKENIAIADTRKSHNLPKADGAQNFAALKLTTRKFNRERQRQRQITFNFFVVLKKTLVNRCVVVFAEKLCISFDLDLVLTTDLLRVP